MSMQAKPFRIHNDHKWFNLGTIISTSFSLPMIIFGNQLAIKFGLGVAIPSIIVGNLVLWLIGMTVISMSMQDRSNAIENVKSYLGNIGAIMMWIVLMVSILNWFIHQLNANIPSIGEYFSIEKKSNLVRLGAGIGFFTTLLSLGGIRLLKWTTLACFPIVFSYYIYVIFRSERSITSIGTLSISFPSIVSCILIIIPGILNLPTLFRYSRSKADSYLGLTVLMILISFYEIATIWMSLDANGNVIYGVSKYSLFSTMTLVFVFLTLVLINMINIYYASACWETFVPRFEGAKGYAIIGLMGTACYTFIQVYTPIQFLEDLTNAYLISLGTVLLIAYMARIIVRHRPHRFEKLLNGLCWLFGCIVSTIYISQDVRSDLQVATTGCGASAILFLIIIFLEETIWATRKVLSRKAK